MITLRAGLLAAVLCVLAISNAAAQHTVPLHNAAALLLSTPEFDLYEGAGSAFCRVRPYSTAILVLKVDRDFVVRIDDAYQQRLNDVILPAIVKRCAGVELVGITIANYVRGVRIDLKRNLHPEDASLPVEQSLNYADVRLEKGRVVGISPGGDPSSINLLEQRRIAYERAQSGEADRKRDRADRAARSETQQRQAAEQLAAMATSRDGQLKIAGLSAENKAVYLRVYDGEFLRQSLRGPDELKPFLMYSGVVQAYSDLCSSSLKNPVDVRIETTTVRTEFRGLSRFRVSETTVSGPIWVEPPYVKAYQASLARFQERYLKKAIDERWDISVQMITQVTQDGLALALDTHRMVKNTGCGTPALRRFLDQLTRFVNDDWSTALPGGGYQSVELPGPQGRRFIYQRTRRDFSPKFAPMGEDQQVTHEIDMSDHQRPGLQLIELTFMSSQALPDEVRQQRPLTRAVIEAIQQRKFYMVTCNYIAKGGNAVVGDWYWKAGEAQPPAEVVAFYGNWVGAPIERCPVQSVSGR